jgi:urease accessory protein
MRTTIIMPLSAITEAGLYRLLTWLSPGYPLGAYSCSHGIEYAVEAAIVRDRDGLVAYVRAALEEGSGRIDAALLSAAWSAVQKGDEERLDEIADLAAAWRGSAEMALETETQGRAFLSTTRAAWPHPGLDAFAARRADAAVALPVAVAVAAACHGISLPPTLAAFLHAFAANLVSAGVRLIPLGQTDGQRALAALEPAVAEVATTAMTVPLDDIATSTPLIDWCSMRHETQYTRLYRS